jgi:hypothetical protein
MNLREKKIHSVSFHDWGWTARPFTLNFAIVGRGFVLTPLFMEPGFAGRELAFSFHLKSHIIPAMSSSGTRMGLPDGYWAEVKSGGQHLRFFAKVHSFSYLAGVFDENRKEVVAQEVVDHLEEAIRRAEDLGARYLRHRGTGELTKVEWHHIARSKTTQGWKA